MDDLLVIARYKEDINWLKKLDKNYIIYNKGDDNIIINNGVVKNIPNIGYEEYCYLNFLIDFYDKLPNRIFFIQANSLEHSPDLLNLLNLQYLYSDVQPLSFFYNERVPGNLITDLTNCLWLDGNKIHINFYNGLLQRYFLPLDSFDYYPPEGLGLYSLFKEFYNNENDVRQCMSNHLKIQLRKFNNKDMTPMCYGAIFAVTKELILKYPKSYYEYLLEKNIEATKFHPKMFGWIMELIWLELFEYNPPRELYTPKLNSFLTWWKNV